MNKRIRKKLHRGEYSEWGRQIVITRNRTDRFDAFVDALLTEAIEANGCYCSAVGRDDSLHVVVELGRPSDDRAGRLQAIYGMARCAV
jgi:uncharacterized protein YggL (DUF469 family)